MFKTPYKLGCEFLYCLPKDISAIVSGYDDMELLQAVLKVNDKVRKNRDWEEMKGRAVI